MPPPILGLIGGIACGKSAVAASLARRGAVVFNADELGHQAIQEPEVRRALVERWGPRVLNADGHVDRPAVAKIVFAKGASAAAERQFLEQLVHPGIRRRIEAGIRQLSDSATPAVVIDAALLLEAGWSKVCSQIVFVECPRDERLRRALSRGWSAEEFARREAAQAPIEEKRCAASYVIDNSGTLDDLEAQIDRFWAAHIE
jgi:dephospho-CoA kinase